MQYLAPELAPLVKSPEDFISLLGFEHISEQNLEKFRESEQSRPYKPLEDVSAEKVSITTKYNSVPVDAFLINSDSNIKRPVVLYMHGGGYLLGSAELSVVRMQELAKRHNCVVLTVDYRLAPETKFPGALEDNYAALTWLYENAESLGIDKDRIVIFGSSAGGGHAAMLAIKARDLGEIPIKHQILLYPMLDDRTGGQIMPAPGIGTFLWTPQSNQFGWRSLLGDYANSDSVLYGSVPARLKDVSGLPPTYIQVGSIDLFVEENIHFATRLITSGVATVLVVIPGMFHSAENVYKDTEIAKRFAEHLHDAIARALQTH